MIIPGHRIRRAGIALLVALALSLGLAGPPGVRAQDGDPPPAARLGGLRHEFQTWCNCGPVNLMMALSYYGWPGDQTVTAAGLKPTVEDKNVSPHELVAFVNRQSDRPDLRALWRAGGDLLTLKRLIAAGFPVIIESGFQPEGHEWMGHYITAIAYDDAAATVWTFDSYNGDGGGLGLATGYAAFAAEWRHFNGTLVLVYPADREADARAALGPLADPVAAAQIALANAQAEIDAGHADAWAYLNAAESALALGDVNAAARYSDLARRAGLPFRALWYRFGPYAAYYRAGRYWELLALVEETIAATENNLEEMNYYRGLAYAALGAPEAALAELDRAVAFNPLYTPAHHARAQVATGTYVPPAPAVVFAHELP